MFGISGDKMSGEKSRHEQKFSVATKGKLWYDFCSVVALYFIEFL